MSNHPESLTPPPVAYHDVTAENITRPDEAGFLLTLARRSSGAFLAACTAVGVLTGCGVDEAVGPSGNANSQPQARVTPKTPQASWEAWEASSPTKPSCEGRYITSLTPSNDLVFTPVERNASEGLLKARTDHLSTAVVLFAINGSDKEVWSAIEPGANASVVVPEDIYLKVISAEKGGFKLSVANTPSAPQQRNFAVGDGLTTLYAAQIYGSPDVAQPSDQYSDAVSAVTTHTDICGQFSVNQQVVTEIVPVKQD